MQLPDFGESPGDLKAEGWISVCFGVLLLMAPGFQIFCHWKERQEQAARYGETTDVEAQGLLSEVTHSRISDTAFEHSERIADIWTGDRGRLAGEKTGRQRGGGVAQRRALNGKAHLEDALASLLSSQHRQMVRVKFFYIRT